MPVKRSILSLLRLRASSSLIANSHHRARVFYFYFCSRATTSRSRRRSFLFPADTIAGCFGRCCCHTFGYRFHSGDCRPSSQSDKEARTPTTATTTTTAAADDHRFERNPSSAAAPAVTDRSRRSSEQQRHDGRDIIVNCSSPSTAEWRHFTQKWRTSRRRRRRKQRPRYHPHRFIWYVYFFIYKRVAAKQR